MPHNSPVPTSKQSYKYLLFGFAGFSESFSDVAQNIMSATYKRVGGWVKRTSCMPKEPSMVPKPSYKIKQAV